MVSAVMNEITQVPISVLIDGEPTRCVDFSDRGLQYGDGVFTTLPVMRGVPLFLDRHLARLKRDASRLDIPFPDEDRIRNEALGLGINHSNSVLKIILTRGSGGRGYRHAGRQAATRVLSCHPQAPALDGIWEHGVKTRFCGLRLGINPRLAGIKHLNRLEQVLARAEWDDDEIREGLLMDADGFLVEGVMSNLFLASGGRLRTPSLDRCGVAGVMRGLICETVRDLGLEVEESRLYPEDAMGADELFLSNSVIGIWPIGELGGKRFPVGRITRAIGERIQDLIEAEVGTA